MTHLKGLVVSVSHGVVTTYRRKRKDGNKDQNLLDEIIDAKVAEVRDLKVDDLMDFRREVKAEAIKHL